MLPSPTDMCFRLTCGVRWLSTCCLQCPKSRWHRCPHCQQRIQDKGLLDEYELQSWFIGRINQFLISQGKQLIGWDEILEGGLAEGAIVMSWRVSSPVLP